MARPPTCRPRWPRGRWSGLTTAADIYGLGAILYTLLTGRPPFRGATLAKTLRQVVQDEPLPPRTRNRQVDGELQAVCRKCLHKDPARRYGSADALANDLRRWLNREPTLAGGPTVGKHLRSWFRRHPLGVAAACLAALVLWIAGAVGSLGELHAANQREAGRLVREVEIQLGMIQRAVDIRARQPDLRERLRAFPDGSPQQRHALDESLTRTTRDYNAWFGLAGGNPLINVFILDERGVLLADTFTPSPAVGQDFSRRNYYGHLFDPEDPQPREAVYVSRAFRSAKDFLYKIAVSTRIWDGEECLGVLVANITIGPRLVVLEMSEEPEGSVVISPMDWSHGTPPSDRLSSHLVVLGRSYAKDRLDPIWIDPGQLPRLADFERNPHLASAADHFREAAALDYHRVGETPLVVVLWHRYPWPIRLVLDARLRRWAVPALAVLAFAPLIPVVVRHASGRLRPASARPRGSPRPAPQ